MTPEEANDLVVLVDGNDHQIGTGGKLAVHRTGQLHRAISVQITDAAGRLLLQKRHHAKYHSGGLWTNTCCSHPRPGETAEGAAVRRLAEEMGIETRLRPLFTTTYRADLDKGLIEHEFVHVFGGAHAGAIRPAVTEADGFEWSTIADLRTAIALQPERYTAWFRIYVRDHWEQLTSAIDAS